MAKDLNLRQYQEDILAKLEAIAGSTSNSANSRLGMLVGGSHVLVDLAEISEVLALPDMFAVPLTQPWFMGMANIRGNLYGISDLGQLIGHAPVARTSSNRVLLVNQDITLQVGLVVDRLVGLRSLDQLKAKKSRKAQGFCFKTQTYDDSEGNNWLELDCHALIESRGFMQPGI